MYYWWPIGSCIRAFDCANINDLGWPWRVITHSVSKHMRLSEPTTKFWMLIDPHCQRRWCNPTTIVSGNIRFMPTFAGFSGEVASSDSGVIENRDFKGFQTLRIRHLRKWSQRYYTALFCPLSPFHWPQNTWPWTAILRLDQPPSWKMSDAIFLQRVMQFTSRLVLGFWVSGSNGPTSIGPNPRSRPSAVLYNFEWPYLI